MWLDHVAMTISSVCRFLSQLYQLSTNSLLAKLNSLLSYTLSLAKVSFKAPESYILRPNQDQLKKIQLLSLRLGIEPAILRIHCGALPTVL